MQAASLLDLAELAAAATRSLRQGVRRSAEVAGLAESEVSVLRRCCQQAIGVAQRELGEALVLSSAHLSEILDSLARRGLVEARRLASDRRRQVWRASASGRTAIERLLAALVDAFGVLACRLDPAELARLTADLQRVLVRMHGPRLTTETWQKGAAA